MYDMIVLGGGAAWRGEIQSHEELFAKLYDRLPKELILTRELMLSSLWRSPEHWEIEAREALPRAKTREAICGSWFLALVPDMVVS